MALQIWLPLNKNGDLSNKGLANVTVTNNGATYNASGKIGGCWNIPSSANSISLVNCMNVLKTYNNYSMCAWVYITNEPTGHSAAILSSGNWNHTNNGNLCFGFYNYSSGFNKLLIPNKGSWLNGINLSNKIVLNTWYHVAISYDGSKTIGYVNGEYVGESSLGGICENSDNNNLKVGGATYTTSFGLRGSINDVRIYDHCLSPKEVKEISKGLVLHYPLNDIPSNNILTDGQSGATNSSYMIKRYTISSPPANNTLCTLTIKMNKIGAGKTWVGIYNSGGSIGLTSFNVSPSESEQILLKTFIWRDSNGSITASNTYINTYVGSSSATSESSIAWIKIEVGDTTGSPKSLNPFSHNIIQDCSGYNNNGTVTGTLTTSTDTPRYDKCTLFDGINSIIKGSLSLANDYKYTASFWYKPTTISSGTLWVFAIASGSNHQFGCYVNDYSIVTNTGGVVGASGGATSFNKPLVANTLYHIVITCDGTNTKVYVDGDLLGTAAKNGTTAGNIFWIGLRPGAPGNYNLNGKLSDFRIYATALSADDIKELYNTAAFIDNHGNVECFQAYEPNTNSRELGPHPTSNVTYLSDGSYKVSGLIWPTTDYIPINPSGKTYYYDIEYSNLNDGNYFLIGFEKYDANKQSGSNSECSYKVSTTSVVSHARVTGTINLSTANGNTAAYTKLRILNNWNGASGTNEAIIHHISLKEASSLIGSEVLKTGQVKCDEFIESPTIASISNRGNIICNQLIEI